MFENYAQWIWVGLAVIFLALIWYYSKKAEEKRVSEILAHKDEWGQETCQRLIKRIIEINDTEEMVSLALGKPSRIDEVVVTEKDNKCRWIYGTPRHGATYIWFKNGKVTKIKK